MGLEVTSDKFEKGVLESKMPVVVDFFATWGGPGKMMAPAIEARASEYEGRAKIGKLDVEESADIAARYGVMMVPTVILFKNGEAVSKNVGLQNKNTLKNELDAAL